MECGWMARGGVGGGVAAGGNVGRRNFPDRDDEWGVAVFVCISLSLSCPFHYYYVHFIILSSC